MSKKRINQTVLDKHHAGELHFYLHVCSSAYLNWQLLSIKCYFWAEHLKAARAMWFFSLWSFVKDRVYISSIPNDLPELKSRTLGRMYAVWLKLYKVKQLFKKSLFYVWCVVCCKLSKLNYVPLKLEHSFMGSLYSIFPSCNFRGEHYILNHRARWIIGQSCMNRFCVTVTLTSCTSHEFS